MAMTMVIPKNSPITTVKITYDSGGSSISSRSSSSRRRMRERRKTKDIHET